MKQINGPKITHNKMLFRAKQFSDFLICPTLYNQGNNHDIFNKNRKGNSKLGRGMERGKLLLLR